MKYRRFAILVALTLVLTACGTEPTPTPIPTSTSPSAVQPTEPPTQAVTEPTNTTAPAASNYQAPLGALAPVPLAANARGSCSNLAYKKGNKIKVAYMPPATEFNYYIAIGEGIKKQAADLGVDQFMLAPQKGSDIAGQMGMIQDAISQNVDAIILSTHDEKAAAPLVKQAVDKGIAVIIVNSDIADFPTAVQGVVGYSQRKGTHQLGDLIAKTVNGKANVGVLEGQPGYHSTERVGGFLDAFKNYPDMKIIASLPTEWNVETGNKVMMDMIQAHPDINLVVAANDYEAIGAQKAAAALNRNDIKIYGNDGDTTGLEEIAAGDIAGTVNTTPFVMGEIALQVTTDCLNGKYPGGFTETPVQMATQDNAVDFLCHPENLYPKPSKTYECSGSSTTDTSSYKAPLGALAPVPLAQNARGSCSNLAYKKGNKIKVAYMPPATEFNYYIAIGEGIKKQAADLGIDQFMLAPQKGSDIAGQMGMIQDAISQNVDAIILSTHDEKAAAPLVKQAVDKGIAVIIVNSDIADFPTAVQGVVGYSQRKGTHQLGDLIAKTVNGKANVGVLEGQPGYHSTERVGGFLDAFKNYPDMKIIASLPTEWNVETGNKVMMDMIQAHPDINLVVAANDYEAIGAQKAAEALNRKDIKIYGNDGDTTGLEEIAAGDIAGTVNTTPFVMGEIALQVTNDCLNGTYPGGFTETPVQMATQDNAVDFLCHPENLYPKPSKTYACR